MVIPLQLGVATNLINGFNPAWDPYRSGEHGLFPVPQRAVEYAAVRSSSAGSSGWGFPVISLHKTPEDLLTALFPCRVLAAEGE